MQQESQLTKICSHGCPFPSAFSAATLALYWTCGRRESTVVEMVLPAPPPPPPGEVTVCTRDKELLTPQGTEGRKTRRERLRMLMELRQRWMGERIKWSRLHFSSTFIGSTRPVEGL